MVEYDNKSASFNDAQGDIERRQQLKARLIDSKVNPLMPNMDFGTYNFIIWKSSLLSLWDDTRPHCTADEVKEIERVKTLIERCPSPIETITRPSGNTDRINYEWWNRLMKLLNILENEIRALEHKYQLDNPAKATEHGL